MIPSGETDVPPWDQVDYDKDDDWMFSSVSRYSHLLMFSLPMIAERLAVSPNGGLVGVVGEKQLEIYKIPAKVAANSAHEEGLVSGRDFGLVAGTLVEGCDVVEFWGEDKLLRGREGILEVWSWEDDLLERKYEIVTESFIPSDITVDYGGEWCVVTGDRTVERIDLTSGSCDSRVLSDGGDITSVYCQDENVVWYVQSCGTVGVVDWREEQIVNSSKLGGLSDIRDNFTFLGSVQVGGVGPEGILRVWDCKNVEGGPVASQEVERGSQGLPRVISGAGDVVGVLWGDRPINLFKQNIGEFESVFSHDGHKGTVNCVIPHRTKERLYLSGDTNQELHLWMYN